VIQPLDVAAWQALSRPGANNSAQAKLSSLLSSTRGALELIMAINSKRLREFPAVERDAIAMGVASPDAHIRDLFEKFLPEEQRPKRLGTAIKPEALLAMAGNASDGRRLFFETAGVQCRNCHQIQGQGTNVGPDLTQIGKKYDRAKILENILDPSRQIDPAFVVHLAVTSDGRLHSGLLVEKSPATIVLKDAKNNLLQLNASDVQQITPQQQSLMPDLLLRDLTAQQVADLLAFLSGLK
jgi:putative heme-binding domain-containing protein